MIFHIAKMFLLFLIEVIVHFRSQGQKPKNLRRQHSQVEQVEMMHTSEPGSRDSLHCKDIVRIVFDEGPKSAKVTRREPMKTFPTAHKHKISRKDCVSYLQIV